MILANAPNLYLGGGCPWEVPFGQLIGDESFRTLDSLYYGYGEKVSQKQIMLRGVEYLAKDFPNLDYIYSCKVMATDLPWRYEKSNIQNLV